MPEVCPNCCVYVSVWKGNLHSCEGLCQCTYACMCKQGVWEDEEFGNQEFATVSFLHSSAGKQAREVIDSFLLPELQESKLFCQLLRPLQIQLFKILIIK